ncbi:MAG: 5-formyltetrahydrofolate cyclo-ligase [Cellvibrionaceae bacterium]|nr:5-formyltetrahydrofolate cyclo-ligase [Cellvibrionaceae bacterium]
MKTKKELRKKLRVSRNNLSSQQQQKAAKYLAQRVASSRVFQRSKNIAFYSASDGEISLSPLLQIANRYRKKCYFPAVKQKQMQFRRLKAKQKLYLRNKFGIKEPNARAAKIRATQLNLVLLPLVGFDAAGNRLGMGGGYYDKTFKFCCKRSHKTVLMGVAHHCQKVEKLFADTWDIPLNTIVTDQQTLRCKHQS